MDARLQRFNPYLVALLLIITIFVVDPASLYSLLLKSNDFSYFNNDSRQQIFPFLHYWNDGLIDNDYIANYYLTAILPRIYSMLMITVSHFIDPRLASGLLANILYSLTCFLVLRCSYHLSGWIGVWGSTIIFLSSSVFPEMISGGIPRSFGFPIVSLAALGLITGKVRYIIAATIIGSMFYYVSAAISGLILLIYLLLIPSAWRVTGATWNFLSRISTVVITGLICLVPFVWSFQSSEHFGSIVTSTEFTLFPEAGPDGRYYPETENLFLAIARWILITFKGDAPLFPVMQRLAITNIWILVLIIIVAIAPFLVRLLKDHHLKRLMILPCVAILFYILSDLVRPYLYFPLRYMIYTLPIVTVIAFPTLLLRSVGFYLNRRNLSNLPTQHILIVLCLTCALVLGGRSSRVGLIKVPDSDQPLYEFISDLPKDTMIAGWPTGIIENIPYVSSRSALLNRETHQAFHKSYILNTRLRMLAIIDSYTDPRPTALLALRDRYNVTHFIVENKFLDKNNLKYHKPFNIYTNARLSDTSAIPFIGTLLGDSIIFSMHGIKIIDLTNL